MKNWLLLLLGPLLAMLTTPSPLCVSDGWNSSAKGWPQMELPPVPVPVGSPPCTMKFLISRWNTVPSYLPCAHRPKKFSAVRGTRSQCTSRFSVPRLVTSCTYPFFFSARMRS